MKLSNSRPHVALGLYLGLAGLLLASLAMASGTRYLHFVLIFLASLLVAYIICWQLFARMSLHLPAFAGSMDQTWGSRASALVLACAVAFTIAHLLRLGGVPAIQGMLEKDYYVVMQIRQYIFHAELHAIWKYGPNILVKSIFPFLVFYYLFRSRLLLVVALVVGGLYAVSLMNKLFVVLLVVPALIHALTSRRWVAVAGLAVVPALGLAFLIQVQNPHLQSQAFIATVDALREHTRLGLDDEQRAALMRYYELHTNAGEGDGDERGGKIATDHSIGALSIASDTLYRRVLLVPGAVMTAWFNHIPSHLPFAKGCGYRWMAPLVGCQYVAYAFKINDIENPGLASKGVRGSMTVASFIEDYANFGVPGLLASGLVLAVILAAIARLFGTAWQSNLALNAIPLILLLEIPLSTVILTGGWIITLLLYLLLARSPTSIVDHAISG